MDTLSLTQPLTLAHSGRLTDTRITITPQPANGFYTVVMKSFPAGGTREAASRIFRTYEAEVVDAEGLLATLRDQGFVEETASPGEAELDELVERVLRRLGVS